MASDNSEWHYERGSSHVRRNKLVEREYVEKRHYDVNVESMLADFGVPQFETKEAGAKPASLFDTHSSPPIKFTVANPKGFSPPEASKHSPAGEIRRHIEPGVDRHERHCCPLRCSTAAVSPYPPQRPEPALFHPGCCASTSCSMTSLGRSSLKGPKAPPR